MALEEFSSAPDFATEMDERDALRRFRNRFLIPHSADGSEVIYFTGNSLGLQPKTVSEYVQQELSDWGTLGVEGHFHAKNPWLQYHEFLTEKMATVIGALPIETVVMNSLTVNLHLLMVSFYQPTADRPFVMIEKGAFPSDQYAVQSQMRCHGLDHEQFLVELAPRDGEYVLRNEDVIATIEEYDDQIAMILLGGVNYYTGQAFDMHAITTAGHKAGAVVGFDLAHAAGNLELKMHDWDVDFAAWCSYKYLNAGPGAVGGAFVHERHSTNFALPRFAGWWGHDKETRFQMGPEFHPIAGAEGWQISNPPILQMAALRASLEIFDEAGMANLCAKSEKMTGYLEFLLAQIDDERISVITPSDPTQRGCQLSIRVKNADKSLFKSITDRGVIADWREPDVIRVAPVPLYNSFVDIFRFGNILKKCVPAG